MHFSNMSNAVLKQITIQLMMARLELVQSRRTLKTWCQAHRLFFSAHPYFWVGTIGHINVAPMFRGGLYIAPS